MTTFVFPPLDTAAEIEVACREAVAATRERYNELQVANLEAKQASDYYHQSAEYMRALQQQVVSRLFPEMD